MTLQAAVATLVERPNLVAVRPNGKKFMLGRQGATIQPFAVAESSVRFRASDILAEDWKVLNAEQFRQHFVKNEALRKKTSKRS